MTKRARARIVLLMVAGAMAGCDGSAPSPTAPGPVPTSAVPPAPGTIVMKGTVSDTAFRELPGARIEVLNGAGAGTSTVADGRGEFSLSGTFDEATQFRATSEGHVTAIRTLQPFCATCHPNWWIHFTLDVLDPPVNMAGNYTVNFVADSACTMLPNDVQSRTFTATIPAALIATPAGPSITVAMGGATFVEGWNTVEVGIAGDYVAFWLETLVEQIAPNVFLSFGGEAAGSVKSSDVSSIALPFAGAIEYCVTKSETGRWQDCYQNQPLTRARCESNNHRLILTRR